jgi:hypothetical protein
MAPAVLATPRGPAHKEQSYGHNQCSVRALCRIEDDSPLTPVSEHEDIVAGVAAGKHRVEVEHFDFGYSLYADSVRVAYFAEGRIGYREWARRNGRLADIHSIDDRYDHDIDELMA